MKIALDATPLLGQTTGVGTYTRGLVEGLATLGLSPVLVPFTLRGGRHPDGLPPTARWRHLPAPARLLQASWSRSTFPPVEVFAGAVDVFHATNFVLPPTWRAGAVVTIHDLTYLEHPEWVTPAVARYRDLVPRSLRHRGTVVTAPSRAVADEVRAAYDLEEERVVVTPLGVDPSWSTAPAPDKSWLAARGLPDDYMVFAGAREPRKNLPMLLEAHRRAFSRGAPALVLAGPAGWGASTAPHAGVHTTGWLPRPELQSLVAGARAVLLPSHYEGFGLPVLEALAAGTAVLASDIPTHREVAAGHAALLPPEDPHTWTEHLVSLPEATATEIRSAAEWAVGHTWENCAALTLTAYERARA